MSMNMFKFLAKLQKILYLIFKQWKYFRVISKSSQCVMSKKKKREINFFSDTKMCREKKLALKLTKISHTKKKEISVVYSMKIKWENFSADVKLWKLFS